MIKKMSTLVFILVVVGMVMGAIKAPRTSKVVKKHIDIQNSSSKVTDFAGVQGSTFDKSANGYGWYWSNTKRIQVNLDPVTGPMVGSIYRRLDTTYGTGTMGGMTGIWETDFSGSAQSVYTNSENQLVTGGTAPGTRFPQTTEFINGYLFGSFTDMDNTPQYGYPMFTVGNITFGWDLPMWSGAKLIESTEGVGGVVAPDAWTIKGDVAYSLEDGYYYWTTWWDVDGGSFETSKLTMVMGRSNTPDDLNSWEWTDYNDIYLDCSSGTGIDDVTGLMEVAYAKDIYGNGTGAGIVVGGFIDDTYIMTNLAGDTLDVTGVSRLGYMYTNNWGADWSLDDATSNWKTPNDAGDNMYAANINKLFDWYGSEVTGDSIGVDSLGAAIYEKIPLNWPYMTWNTHVTVTENNIAHVMIKLYGALSTESPDSYYITNDEQVIAGYYDVVGEITETGVNWIRVSHIASGMGIPDDTMETNGNSGNTHKFSNGYAGNGVVYATWLDRPESRYVVPNPDLFAAPDSDYMDDGYFTYSPDDGRTWAIDKVVNMDNDLHPETPYELKYAFNVTNTSALMEEGWTVANRGTNIGGQDGNGVLTVYAASQYCDTENPIAPPIDSYRDYQQFLKLWKITGTETGIEAEAVSMEKDFILYQNYPNPFNPTTEIEFNIQRASDVKLAVYNIKGEVVANLIDEKMNKGFHSVNFNASSLNSGVYFYQINVNGMRTSQKMVLVK